MSGRILIIQMAKLGDFIQSTPLLANARRNFPGAEIVLAGEAPAVLEAAALSPLVDEVLALSETGPPPAGPFEAVFTLNSHPRALALADGLRARRRYGPRLKGGQTRFTPAQNFIMALMRDGCRDLGRFNLVDVWVSLCPGARPEALLWPGAGAAPVLKEAAGLKIGLQLGSKNHLRRWPVEHFADLAQRLAEAEPVTPILLGSGSERALGARFEKLFREPVLNLMGRTNLEELAAALAGLDLLITADTGTMHLAAAVGTPILALFFGPAFGPETGPYGSGHLIYQARADCAPCRESAECRRRQCLEMPLPALAARAARLRLGRAADLPPLPPGHRIWRTARDGSGQSLTALGRPELTGREALALIAAEAGRPLLSPGEAAAPARVMAALAGFEAGRFISIDGSILKRLAAALPGPEYDGAAFLAAAGKLAADLGFKIALT